jgi:N-acetylglucosaminyldiphosphoundecaprenol N-acetyl-beta-D-mannosaminyltransferase
VIDRGRHPVLGVLISAVDYDAAVERIVAAAAERRSCAVSALAVHGLMTGALDACHRYRLNRIDLLVPDGQPVRWALRWLHGVRLPDRVYGPNLMLRTCERAARDGLPIFLFGGTEALLERLRENLLARFPDLVIAGSRASRFRQLDGAEREELAEAIRGSGAAITFVGLGCPRQEVWVYEFRDDLPMPLLAVGAAFNFHAGILPQAPILLQRLGLEWLYRLAAEPRRLWKRYLLLNPLYLLLVGMQRLHLGRFDPDSATPPTDERRYG